MNLYAKQIQIVKVFGHEDRDERRYAPPEVIGTGKTVMQENPDYSLISTSYIEQLNATTRLHMRRLTRLTLAFSKRPENFRTAFGLHFAYYNFVRRRNTLRCTPGNSRWRREHILDRGRSCGGCEVTYLEELQRIIHRLHSLRSTHIKSVPVTARFKGEVIWDGIVEVFELHGHPKANHAYAWTHATDDPDVPKRSVTVLHVPPAVWPITAVRVAIMQEFKELRSNADPEAEAS